MRSGRINSNLVIGLVVGAVVLLGIYENFFASRAAQPTTASQQPVSTTAEVRSRLETMGYALEATHNTLGHGATYSRDFKAAKLKVDLVWLTKELQIASFDGYLTGGDFESDLGLEIFRAMLADVDEVFGCKAAALRAYSTGKRQEEGSLRNEGTATTPDGWEVKSLEYLRFVPNAKEPTQLRYRVMVSRVPGY